MERGAGRPRARCLVRLADPTEYTSVTEILEIAFGRKLSREAIEGFRRRSIEERQLAFLAIVDDKVAGCVVAEAAPSTILYNLAVLPEYRRRGLGAALVNRSIDLIHEEVRPSTYWIAVHPSRPEGVERFRRLGFRQVAVEDGFKLMRRPSPSSGLASHEIESSMVGPSSLQVPPK